MASPSIIILTRIIRIYSSPSQPVQYEAKDMYMLRERSICTSPPTPLNLPRPPSNHSQATILKESRVAATRDQELPASGWTTTSAYGRLLTLLLGRWSHERQCPSLIGK